MENNTLILLAMGWKGCWFGGENLKINTENSRRLTFKKVWITKENIVDLCKNIENESDLFLVDLISLDLDGNDYYLVKELLEQGITPQIFIVEYNAKFPPPLEFVIEYDCNHCWNYDDYFGASLTSFNFLFEKYGYFLVCCNSASGTNAFFVRNEFKDLFPDVFMSLDEKYCTPFYITISKYGHKSSAKTIERIINN